MSFQPTLRQLRHLAALDEARHFGRAALACNVTQSTLSASIKELEAGLGAALVDRTRRRVVLTPLGRTTAEQGRRILAEVESLVADAASGAEPLAGTLRLGVIPTIAPFLLAPILPRLRRAHPRLKLYLIEDLTEVLVARLADGRLDALLLALPCDCGDVESRILWDDRFVLACRPEHPLARRSVVTAADLAGAPPMLLRDGHCLRAHALAACQLGRAHGFDRVEATSLHTLVQMVDNGLGVTLLPELALRGGIIDNTELVTRPLSGASAARQIGLAWRRGSGRAEEFDLLARRIVDLAREAGLIDETTPMEPAGHARA